MKKVIVLSALLLVTGMSVYAQEDFSKSIKTTTTIVENADKYKVETNRFWSKLVCNCRWRCLDLFR